VRRLSRTCAVAVAVSMLGGCAGQFPVGGQTLARENRDLRAMLKQAMRQVRQLELEQERLRASVDTLEYRQRLIAKRAGMETADTGTDDKPASAGVQPNSLANGSNAVGDYGSEMPRVGLEAFRQGGGGSAALQPKSEPPSGLVAGGGAGLAVQDAEARRRIRGRVVGPVAEAPQRKPSREARVLPSAAGPRAAQAGRRPSAVPAEEKLELPEVPDSLKSSAYATAAEQIRAGAYEDAVQNLRDFIHDNPRSAYADDAQYWIGEAYLRQGAYSKAIIEFNQVVVHHGSGNRSAKALLKQAEVFSLLGDDVDARFSLQKVVNNYAGSPEAVRARALLENRGDRDSAAP